MGEFTKASFNTTKRMEKGSLPIQMAQNMKVSGKMMSLMEWVSFSGLMARSTMDSGRLETSMAKE